MSMFGEPVELVELQTRNNTADLLCLFVWLHNLAKKNVIYISK